ncbi:carbamoyltransferase HypF [Halomonas sp. V046]|uniref:carbamoyltransferase HypF n=1 Tax=Halomonas sp. V046 TaxID=3459611 RepID=UPI004043C518
MLKPHASTSSWEIRVRGCVQGVGFRPTVWQLATRLALDGEVLNDGEGVLIRASGPASQLQHLVRALRDDPPPLATITSIDVASCCHPITATGFGIVDSHGGATRTDIAPDAAVCATCQEEILSSDQRRSGYALTNCTHCGPRLSIIEAMPYDRAATTMSRFPLCADCRREYLDPANRRFHAEPIACPACGPTPRLITLGEPPSSATPNHDPVSEAAALIDAGHIVAIKGLGGYHLACDATRTDVVDRLRRLKQRPTKPLAVMVAGIDMLHRYCEPSTQETATLVSPAAPIVLCRKRRDQQNDSGGLAQNLAPGVSLLGVMLPYTPLHVLLCRHLSGPIVMTSGNVSGAPQLTDDAELATMMASIASHALTHDRAIARRIDDSLVRLAGGKVRVLRRARGYAPMSLPLPPGFSCDASGLALGPQQKATFCLIEGGRAILSPHQGDLDDAATLDDYERNLADFRALYDLKPRWLACDAHPGYQTTRLAYEMATPERLPVIPISHHHAHIAACLAENGYPLDAPAVMGIVLDGLGLGEDGSLWGGELLMADYRESSRVAHLRPVAMPGGAAASREPWRNLLAQLQAGPGLDALLRRYPELSLLRRLEAKPVATLSGMIERGINCPKASSCGRLFDAVAAAVQLCFDHQHHEGEAAMALEALALETTLLSPDTPTAADARQDASGAGSLEPGELLPYPFAIQTDDDSGLFVIDPTPMWQALFEDLSAIDKTTASAAAIISTRFHRGLASTLADLTRRLVATRGFDTVVLSGGCFHNRRLLEETLQRLAPLPIRVLTHRQVPANDGGIALGQAVIAAAQHPGSHRDAT